MAYNEEATKNLDIYTDLLKLTKRTQIFYETDSFIILSPAVQSKPEYSRFDVLIGNMGLVLAAKKPGILAIRYFDEILVLDIDEFKRYLRDPEFIVFGSKNPKWEYEVVLDKEIYEVKLVKKDLRKKLQVFNREGFIKYLKEIFSNTYSINNLIPIDSLMPHIHNYITSKGFNYTEANIKNLYLSLRSKPFVIISGISGTGKTKIVQLFAESIGATEDNGQFTLIPVRPDWSDSSDLLGYKDIKEEFQKGPLTKVIERAHQNPELPYFVLLDEMNLARVEYYFSDVLSVMETRREEDGKIVSSQLISYKNQQKETVSVTLPNNLYVIGTVNMDETTHPFSKKVLDRANTIEFNEINFETNDFVEGEVSPIKIGNEQFESTYLFLKQAYPGNENLIKQISSELTEINVILQPIHAQVGYRVRDEICYYMIHNNKWGLLEYKVALDLCIMQKILPRISGSSKHVEEVLKSLYLKYAGKEYVEKAVVDKTASLTERKLVEMLRRLDRDGFTSFWGA